MKRLEPNLLLAVSTGLTLLLVLLTTSLTEPVAVQLRNALMAVICAGGFVLLSPRMARMTGQPPRPPLIHPDSPGTLVWAALFPAVVAVIAMLPIFFPGPDYGLAVIIAAVIFGLTVESAIKAARVG